MSDKHLISSRTDPQSGYRIEHRRSIFGGEFFIAEDRWRNFIAGATEQEAIERKRAVDAKLEAI